MPDAKVTDEERLLQIKRAHASRRPSDANPAWKNSHSDLGFVLAYLESIAPTQGADARHDRLRKFLDVAAGEGYVFDGVDAAELYIELFPERYAAIAPRGKS